MRSKQRPAFLLAIILFIAGAQSAVAQKKPNIVILATGGTIAGAAATGTQAGYKSGAVTIDAMIAAVPGISDMANIKGEQISNVGSQDMSFDIMLKVAKRINELMSKSDVDGFVITHGTDTMTQTAKSLLGIPGKVIVLTGAMQPARFHTSDAAFNLGCAIAAVQLASPGVYIAMNGYVFPAESVRKNLEKGRFEWA